MRVALGFFAHTGYSDGVLRGVAAFARPHRQWVFDRVAPTLAGAQRLLNQAPDGVLLCTSDERVLEVFERVKIPVVNTGAPAPGRRVAQVLNDEAAVGEMAARYFIARGYRQFAYASRVGGHPDARLTAFQATLAKQGFSRCAVFESAREREFTPSERRIGLSQWLRELPKPVALFCMYDAQASTVAEHCRAAGIAVPAEIAILGVDNDITGCSLADPPLSSIQTAAERIGYEAAQLLDRYFSEGGWQVRTLKVPPVRVVSRRSTDAVAVPDKLVEAALRMMQADLARTSSFETFCERLKCSRRSLERRFQSVMSQSPSHAWAGLRLHEAERLLVETDLAVEEVARRTGFGDSRQLAAAVRKSTGMVPSQFRRHAGAAGALRPAPPKSPSRQSRSGSGE
jgi:LacI family transcriptional regulator